MEDMIALELTASDHLVLAYSTIFETIDGFCLFLGSLNILDLYLSLSILRNNIPDEWEIFLKILHKLFELVELFVIFEQA